LLNTLPQNAEASEHIHGDLPFSNGGNSAILISDITLENVKDFRKKSAKNLHCASGLYQS
jgi:hypothetical protein